MPAVLLDQRLPRPVQDACLAAVPAAIAEQNFDGLLKAIRAMPGAGAATAQPGRFSSLAATIQNLAVLAAAPREEASPYPRLHRSLEYWRYLDGWLAEPDLRMNALKRLGRIAASLPPAVQDELWKRLTPLLVKQFLANPGMEMQESMEWILLFLGPRHAKGPRGLFNDIWKLVETGYPRQFYRKVIPCRDLIAAGLGARTGWPDKIGGAARREMFDAVLRLASIVVPQNREVLAELDRIAKTWPDGPARFELERLNEHIPILARPRNGLFKRMTRALGAPVRWLTGRGPKPQRGRSR